MKKKANRIHWRKWSVVLLLLYVGLGANMAVAYEPKLSTGNNFSLISTGSGTTAATSGSNEIKFYWTGVPKTSVAVSGQVENAVVSLTTSTLSCTKLYGQSWSIHDIAVYSAGTYTVWDGCVKGSPGCGSGSPITFTVGADEFGVHYLLDWAASAVNKNIDVVNIWQRNAVFAPSTMYDGGCIGGDAGRTWDHMSKDFIGGDVNGWIITQGTITGLLGLSANLNVMAPVVVPVVESFNNNFTMNQPDGIAFGGTNDVHWTWDGTMKTAVAVSGQVPNASISTLYPFFGVSWLAHDVAIYGPGTYTVYSKCDAGNPGCEEVDGVHPPITFTVPAGEIGGHMLFLWSGNENIDVVDIWHSGPFLPSPMWLGLGGFNPIDRVWDHMSYDWGGWDGTDKVQTPPDGINGYNMVDGPFASMNANFNWDGVICTAPAAGCDDSDICTADAYTIVQGPGDCPCTHTATVPASCDDNDICTTDGCSSNACTNVAIVPASCDDNDICTTDGCTANACTNTPTIPVSCNDNEVCTTDGCTDNACTHTNNTAPCDDSLFCNGNDTCAGGSCGHSGDPCIAPNPLCDEVGDQCIACTLNIECDDNNICTTDTCDVGTGACSHTAVVPPSCDDNNICTTDGCTANACTYTAVVPPACDDNDICTTDGCTANACTNSAVVPPSCNDNTACTTDGCSANVCSNVSVDCDDNNICTTDSCVPATGCVYAAAVPPSCDDNDICTTDGCTANACTNAATVPGSCNDNNVCTTDTCTSNACGHANNTSSCDDNNLCTTSDVCSGGSCGGTLNLCSDGKDYTVDSCSTSSGACSHHYTTHTGCLNGADPCVPTVTGDALKALRIAAGLDTPTTDEVAYCDVAPLVSGIPAPDGKCTIGDVVVILRRALDKIPGW